MLTQIIEQLRAYAPIFDNRIAGTAEFAALEAGKENLPVPSAFVVLTREIASEPSFSKQLNREYFAVIVCVDNRQDWRGQGGVQQIEEVKRQLVRALYHWKPDCCYEYVHYAGGQFLHMDRARQWWQFEFGVDRMYTEQDGFLSIEDAQQTEDGGMVTPFAVFHNEWDMASPRNDPQLPASPDGQIDAIDTTFLEQT